jgi:hypothetical protein
MADRLSPQFTRFKDTFRRPDHEGDEARRCGGCGSRNLHLFAHSDRDLGVCLDCRRIQEVEMRDWPESRMCNNCAFRAGSPERAAPYRWAEIEATLDDGLMFHCHKGLPYDPRSGRFAAPDPAAGRVTVCAGWLSARIARLRRKKSAHV